MQHNYDLSRHSLPQTPPYYDIPITTLDGLVDLLDVLEDELASCPGIVPLLSHTLREELEEVVGYDR